MSLFAGTFGAALSTWRKRPLSGRFGRAVALGCLLAPALRRSTVAIDCSPLCARSVPRGSSPRAAGAEIK